jgi:hypothetical protein
VGLSHMRVDAWVMPDAASEDGLEGEGRPDALERALGAGDAAAELASYDFTALIQLA